MRISDWSSDVCSSDLTAVEDAPRTRELVEEDLLDGGVDVDRAGERLAHALVGEDAVLLVQVQRIRQAGVLLRLDGDVGGHLGGEVGWQLADHKIGRASCRERVCQYV